ncbi:MAG: hypothetical protein LBB49_05530 [Gracilibacteraceae bacterium]|nr:hypothetical protein [Gracilibacteraceae bacterium]
MRMRLFLVLGVLLAVLMLAACSKEVIQDTPEPADKVITLPDEKEIKVSREGEEEVFTGTLAISNKGYAIYLLPDYELQDSSWFDLVVPKEGSGINPGIFLKIYEVDPLNPISESEGEYGVTPMANYRRVSLKVKAFEVQINYPWEAAEGGAVLMREMSRTICDVEWSE